MKKLLVILIAALSFTAASAQNREDSYNRQDRYQGNQIRDNRYPNDQHRSNDYVYNNNNAYNRDRSDDHSREAGYDRMNRQYDQRTNGYGNDRSLGGYERNGRTSEAEHGRHQKSKAFGNGMIVGGIAGVLIGVLAGH